MRIKDTVLIIRGLKSTREDRKQMIEYAFILQVRKLIIVSEVKELTLRVSQSSGTLNKEPVGESLLK